MVSTNICKIYTTNWFVNFFSGDDDLESQDSELPTTVHSQYNIDSEEEIYIDSENSDEKSADNIPIYIHSPREPTVKVEAEKEHDYKEVVTVSTEVGTSTYASANSTPTVSDPTDMITVSARVLSEKSTSISLEKLKDFDEKTTITVEDSEMTTPYKSDEKPIYEKTTPYKSDEKLIYEKTTPLPMMDSFSEA